MTLLTEIKRIKTLMQIKEDSADNVVIRPYNHETDFEQIYSHLEEVYHKIGWGAAGIWGILKSGARLGVVLEINGEVAGFYFLKENPIPEIRNSEVYDMLKDMRGIEGVGLGIFEKYKGLGLGKKLIEYPQSMGYDYIWGYQLKSLENIDDWLKRRKIYAEGGGQYITYQIFNSNEENS